MDGFAEVLSYRLTKSMERCGIVRWLCVLQFFLMIQMFHGNTHEFLSHFCELFNLWLPLLLALKLLQLLSLPIKSKLAQVESLLSILKPDFEGQQQHDC